MWPTPTASDHKGSGPTVVRKDGKLRNDRLDYAVEQFWPTPTSMTGGEGVAPSHLDGSHGWNIGAAVNAADPKSGGKLNPKWVAWLMGYPIEYLNSVPWETASSRRPRKKSDKR